MTKKHPEHSNRSLLVLLFSSIGCWLFGSRLLSFGLLFLLCSCLFLTLFFISCLFFCGFLFSGLLSLFCDLLLSLGLFFLCLLSFTLSLSLNFGFCFLFCGLLFGLCLFFSFTFGFCLSFFVLFFCLGFYSFLFSIAILFNLLILGGSFLFFCLSFDFTVLLLFFVHLGILGFCFGLSDWLFLLFDFSIFFGTIFSCWLFFLLNNLSFFNCWFCVTVLIGGVLRLNLSCWFWRFFYRLIDDFTACLKFFRLWCGLNRSRWGHRLDNLLWGGS